MLEKIKVRLTDDQIEDIVSVIRHSYMFEHIEYADIENHRANIRKQLKTIEIYPEKIAELKRIIEREYHAAQIAPGEAVGVLAACSIGEQNTQSNLNSFHQSGTLKLNLTGGMSRMNELMNATENAKTPSLTIYLAPEYAKLDLGEIRKVAFTKLIHVKVDDILTDIQILDNTKLEPFYEVYKFFYHDEFEQCSTRVRFQCNVEKLWLHKITLPYIVSCIEKAIDTTDRISFVYSPDALGILDCWIHDDNVIDFTQLLQIENEKMLRVLTPEVKMKYYINKMIIPNILNIVLSGVEGIKECGYTEEKEDWRIDTKGGVLKKLIYLPYVDARRCRSNDMHEIYELFGIEAVKQFLRDEYATLIKVNQRHLELLIDTMTVSGDIQRVTRNGIDRKQVGAIAKVSFEQPLENFLISASYGETDPLRSVSACITFGKQAHIGTNYMGMIPFEKYDGKRPIPKWEVPTQMSNEEEEEEFEDEEEEIWEDMEVKNKVADEEEETAFGETLYTDDVEDEGEYE